MRSTLKPVQNREQTFDLSRLVQHGASNLMLARQSATRIVFPDASVKSMASACNQKTSRLWSVRLRPAEPSRCWVMLTKSTTMIFPREGTCAVAP